MRSAVHFSRNLSSRRRPEILPFTQRGVLLPLFATEFYQSLSSKKVVRRCVRRCVFGSQPSLDCHRDVVLQAAHTYPSSFERVDELSQHQKRESLRTAHETERWRNNRTLKPTTKLRADENPPLQRHPKKSTPFTHGRNEAASSHVDSRALPALTQKPFHCV